MKTGLIFSGQGAQAVGMGKSFYDASADVRGIYDLANAVMGDNFTNICFEGPQETLTQTNFCQPALYVHGFAAMTLLKQANPELEVSAAAGLSLGELTALAAAGVFDFVTGLKIVAKRGALMQEACDATDGAMAAIIGADAATVQQLCDAHDVDMANLNCPGQIVISGESAKIAAAVEAAPEMGIKRAIPLKVAGAYHSRLMQSAADQFEAFLADIDFNTPAFPVFTNTTGNQVSNPADIKAALVKQVTSSVRWEDNFRNMTAMGITNFYECGMGNVLAGMAKKIDSNATVTLVQEYSNVEALQTANA